MIDMTKTASEMAHEARARWPFRARIAQVLIHEWNEGDGTQDDPIGRVYALRNLDGDLIATFRPLVEGDMQGYGVVQRLLDGA